MAQKKISYALVPRDSDEGRSIYGVLDRLIERYHEHLTNARIAIAWNLTWQPDVDGRCTLGKCKRASDLDRELAPYDFVVMLRREFYEDASVTDAQREALLDHELSHAEVTLDESGEPAVDTKGRTVYRIRKHDCEEFVDVVRRNGIWKADVEAFAAALERARQTKGKTPEEVDQARREAVTAAACAEGQELLRRFRAAGPEGVDEETVRRIAQNPAIRAAVEKLRPREGSLTISHAGKSVTLHDDGRTVTEGA